MNLEPGTKLGPYQILAFNGETYKASDTRMNRSVAIKLLPPEFSGNTELKQRLERVAKAITSFNHPHICSVYEVAQENGMDYLVTEFVEGETLAQRLTRGPLELEEALKIATAIADALDKAHRSGISHRGLNPSTVMLTPTGIKLLDFGLGNLSLSSVPAGSASSLPTRSTAAPLSAVPSTAAPYIPPEQWQGAEADARTDIFAFGAILYEMVAGKPAFEGKNAALLIAAIETIDPEPLSKIQPMTPPALDFIVRQCLAKDPKQRFQTAWDLMTQLRWIAEGGTQIGIPAPLAARRKKRDRIVWAALGAAALLAAAMIPAAVNYVRGPADSDEVRFSLNIGNLGVGGSPVSISPDGRRLIRAVSGAIGLNSLLLNSVTQQVLINDSNVVQPFWSPDSRSIAFFNYTERKLKKAEFSGGPSQNICDVSGPFGGGTWNSDGIIVFAAGGVLYRVLAAGGQPTPITTLDSSKQETEHLAPYFLPDGKHYLFLALSSQSSNSAIYAGSLDSKERTRLFASESRAVYAPGYILFNRDTTVFAQPFEPGKLALTGEPVRIADGVLLMNGGTTTNTTPSISRSAGFAVSQNGVLAYRLGGNASSTQGQRVNVNDRALTWFDRSGRRTGQAGGPAPYAGVNLSPDGKRFAVHQHEANGGDSWSFDLAEGRMQRLTFDAAQDNAMPVWSPDGTHIAFGSRRNNKWGLYVKAADGAANEELITESETPKMPMSWSPDGKLLIYWVDDPQTHGDVWAVPVSGDKKPISIVQSQYNETNPQVSPDGKWIAYDSNDTGHLEVYIKPFPEGPGKWQISTDGGRWPRWRGDGKELYFVLAPSVWAADIRVTGASIDAGVPHALFGLGGDPTITHPTSYHPYAVSADGQRFLIPQPPGATIAGGVADAIAQAADQGGTTAANGTNAVTVVVNWPHMLKK